MFGPSLFFFSCLVRCTLAGSCHQEQRQGLNPGSPLVHTSKWHSPLTKHLLGGWGFSQVAAAMGAGVWKAPGICTKDMPGKACSLRHTKNDITQRSINRELADSIMADAHTEWRAGSLLKKHKNISIQCNGVLFKIHSC